MTKKKLLTSGKVARILVVDDHPLIRNGLGELIAEHADLVVCGEATNVTEALQLLKTVPADVAIVDLGLVDSHGLELVKAIKDDFPKVKTLVMTAYDENLYAERALRAGALGYINKREVQENIITAIRTVLDGKRYISRRIAERLIESSLGAKPLTGNDPSQRLSTREIEIFRMIGEGKSSGAIAEDLFLSSHTIDSHRENIKRKLNLKNAGELTRSAVQWVLENG
ncbi:MAG: response regulator transcription factor [Pirellulaceae bacterium]|nr:response regulator transcription factor [Pirellulaceae bacterium]